MNDISEDKNLIRYRYMILFGVILGIILLFTGIIIYVIQNKKTNPSKNILNIGISLIVIGSFIITLPITIPIIGIITKIILGKITPNDE